MDLLTSCIPETVSFPVAVGLTALVTISGIAAWSMYSIKTQKSLKKGKFGVMEILSETRDIYGRASLIPHIARRFSRGSITSLRRSFVRISGDQFDQGSRKGSIRVKGDVAFRYTENGEKQAMYGRREPTNLSLRELVSEKTTMIEIEEDVFKRMNWSMMIGECVPLKDNKNKSVPFKIEGSYSFCHRDYVTHEELMGMMWKRGGIEGFLFKPARAGVIVVDKDSNCVLTERSKLLRFIPISIQWEGKIEEGSIHWHTSSLSMGWESFRKFFDKPPAAEKLRKNPWHISIPRDDDTADILCFDREGKGHLVFSKETCLNKGLKSD